MFCASLRARCREWSDCRFVLVGVCDHVIVFSGQRAVPLARAYFGTLHEDRTHLALGKEHARSAAGQVSGNGRADRAYGENWNPKPIRLTLSL